MFPKRFHRSMLLEVCVRDTVIATVSELDPPCEKNPSVSISRGDQVMFRDRAGASILHWFNHEQGWAHFSIRVSAGLACQTDCVVSEHSKFDPQELATGRATGIRFQPFLIDEAKDSNSIFVGRGLFFRGLHFSGTVTPGNVSLSCICDVCARNFRLQSFHAGFSNCGYFYSDSGRYTLTVSEHVEGSPPARGPANREALAALETQLPQAPDGTAFRYTNPLRCPHCGAPYIDFEKHPEDREHEYYGNTLFGESPLHYEP